MLRLLHEQIEQRCDRVRRCQFDLCEVGGDHLRGRGQGEEGRQGLVVRGLQVRQRVEIGVEEDVHNLEPVVVGDEAVGLPGCRDRDRRGDDLLRRGPHEVVPLPGEHEGQEQDVEVVGVEDGVDEPRIPLRGDAGEP